jgi:hypothetical protein
VHRQARSSWSTCGPADRWGIAPAADVAHPGDSRIVLVASRDGLVHGLRLAIAWPAHGVRCAGAPSLRWPWAWPVRCGRQAQWPPCARRHRPAVTEARCRRHNRPVGARAGSGTHRGGRDRRPAVAVDLGSHAAVLGTHRPGNSSVPVVSGNLVVAATSFGQLCSIVAPDRAVGSVILRERRPPSRWARRAFAAGRWWIRPSG